MNFTPSLNFPSPSSYQDSNRKRQSGLENVQPHIPSAMRRISAKIIPKFRSSSSVNPKSTMASSGGAKGLEPVDLQKKSVEEEKNEKSPPSKPPPPPPEMPVPGDCCGSGCVRCVWDVYYEEVEAYNKICEKGSAPPSA